MLRFIVILCIFMSLVSLLTGCQHYQLGSSAQLPFRSIYIQPVLNKSYAPQAQSLVTTNLINSFLRDGRVRVTDPAQADATLVVTLKNYEKKLAATQNSDYGRARTVSLRLVATFDLVNNRDGSFFFQDRSLDAEELIFSSSDNNASLPKAEYQSMPELAHKLANNIHNSIVDVW